jgi:hypothetical protein
MRFRFCNFNHLYSAIGGLTIFTSVQIVVENYGSLVIRFLGTLISEFHDIKRCIAEGKKARNYKDIGYCGGLYLSHLLDTVL